MVSLGVILYFSKFWGFFEFLGEGGVKEHKVASAVTRNFFGVSVFQQHSKEKNRCIAGKSEGGGVGGL